MRCPDLALGQVRQEGAKISNGPGFGFKPLGTGLTGTGSADAGIVYQDVERSDVAWTAPKTSCGRVARSRLLQLEEQPAAAL